MARLPEYCAVDEKPEDEIALDIFGMLIVNASNLRLAKIAVTI